MLRQYDPKQVVMTFGPTIMSGFAAGTFIAATRNVDQWDMIAGADGEVMRIKNLDDSGLVTITIQQGSLTNLLLQAVADLDRLTNVGVLPLLVKDFTGDTAFVKSGQAFIKKVPDWARATADLSNVEWIFACPVLQIKHGTNQEPA